MLLNLAQMKLWHLARQHVNSDSGVQHTAASLSLEDKAGAFQDMAVKDWWRPAVKENVARGMGQETLQWLIHVWIPFI